MREDRRDGFKVTYEGIEVEVIVSARAERIVREYNMIMSNVYASVVSALDYVLDYKNETVFAVVDLGLEYTVIAAIHTEGVNVFIDIIEIIDNTNVFVRNGLEIVRVGEKLLNKSKN